MTSSFDLSPHRPPVDPDQVDDLRRRLFGGDAAQLQVPGYEIEAELGRGAFGRVYRAFDRRFARKVALKVIRVDGPTALLRVEREAQALARLSHPNVVQVYDKGPAGDEHYFLALEYLEGESLEAWLRHGRRSLAEVTDLFLPIARALAAAHEAGLVHRDFKPANVMVANDGRVRLLDFGLARAAIMGPVDPADQTTPTTSPPADSASEPAAARTDQPDVPIARRSGEAESTGPAEQADATSPRGSAPAILPSAVPASAGHLATPLTMAGDFVGTPFYAAPEQHRGAADARSDQFSFCVALFEALYGRRPYTIDRSKDVAAQLESQSVDFRRGGARVPRWIIALLRRGLALDPAQRHPSMAAIAERLHHRLHVHPPRMRLLRLAGGTTIATALAVGLAIETEPERIAQCRSDRATAPASWSASIDTVAEHSPSTAADLQRYADAWSQQHARACNEPEQSQRDLIDQCLGRTRGAFDHLSTWLGSADPATWARLDQHPGPHPFADVIETLPSPSACVIDPRATATTPVMEVWDDLLEARIHEAAGELDDAELAADQALEAARRLNLRPLEVAAEYRGFVIDQRRDKPRRKSQTEILKLLLAAQDAGMLHTMAEIAVSAMRGVSQGSADINNRIPRGELLGVAEKLADIRKNEDLSDETRGWLAFIEASIYHRLNDRKTARATHLVAVELLRRGGVPEKFVGLAAFRAAVAAALTEDVGPAIAEIGRTLAERRTTLSGNKADLANDLTDVGDFFWNISDFKMAIDFYEEADRLFEQEGLPLARAMAQHEIATIHADIALRVYRRMTPAEREAEKPTKEFRRFWKYGDLAIQKALRVEELLDPLRPPLDDLSVEPRSPIAQARIETGIMRIYGLSENCRERLLQSVRHVNRICAALHGANHSCTTARNFWLKMMEQDSLETDAKQTCPPRRGPFPLEQ